MRRLNTNFLAFSFLFSAAFMMSGVVGCDSGSKTPATTDDDDDGNNEDSQADDDDDGNTTTDTTTDTTTNTDTTTDPTTETGDLKANGEECESGEECQGHYCTEMRVQGGMTKMVCSECLSDESCQGDALGLNCVTDRMTDPEKPYKKCSTGELGESCQSDAGCAGMICRLTETPGGTRGTCGECHDDKECQDSGAGKACTNKDNGGVVYPQCSAGALGEACEGDDSCESGICGEIQGGGPQGTTKRCSMCRGEDKECVDAGTGKNCTVMGEMSSIYLGCGMGALGEDCDSEEGCTDSHCAAIAGQNVCSACSEDSHCAAEQNCSIVAGTSGFDFSRGCVDKKSVANDGLCIPGDEVCMNHCVLIESMFLKDMGACGECRPDMAEADCGTGKTCTPPSIGMGGITGSVCM
jgi:hypothetical protein